MENILLRGSHSREETANEGHLEIQISAAPVVGKEIADSFKKLNRRKC